MTPCLVTEGEQYFLKREDGNTKIFRNIGTSLSKYNSGQSSATTEAGGNVGEV